MANDTVGLVNQIADMSLSTVVTTARATWASNPENVCHRRIFYEHQHFLYLRAEINSHGFKEDSIMDMRYSEVLH